MDTRPVYRTPANGSRRRSPELDTSTSERSLARVRRRLEDVASESVALAIKAYAEEILEVADPERGWGAVSIGLRCEPRQLSCGPRWLSRGEARRTISSRTARLRLLSATAKCDPREEVVVMASVPNRGGFVVPIPGQELEGLALEHEEEEAQA